MEEEIEDIIKNRLDGLNLSAYINVEAVARGLAKEIKQRLEEEEYI